MRSSRLVSAPSIDTTLPALTQVALGSYGANSGLTGRGNTPVSMLGADTSLDERIVYNYVAP